MHNSDCFSLKTRCSAQSSKSGMRARERGGLRYTRHIISCNTYRGSQQQEELVINSVLTQVILGATITRLHPNMPKIGYLKANCSGAAPVIN